MVESLNAQLDEFVLKLSAIRDQMDRYSVSENGIARYNKLIAEYANIEKDYEALRSSYPSTTISAGCIET